MKRPSDGTGWIEAASGRTGTEPVFGSTTMYCSIIMLSSCIRLWQWYMNGQPSLRSSNRMMMRALAPAVLRIVTESLTNVRRHARRVGRVDVVVRHDGDRVVVAVTDDGEPVGAGAHDAFGIVGMRERAESLGGSLTAGPIATGGWLVRAELPVPAVRPVRPEPVG